jgi:hypothetical protein
MATDQEIRDAGFKYIPQQQYLQNPFELPTTPEEEPVINQGIVNTNAFTGGGGGNDFSVYNPDPNSIVNRNYNPYDYRLAADIDEGSDESYYTGPEPTGLGKFAQFASSFIPGAGIARFIGNYLPVNRRSIMENQLGGQGIMIDNIGRIVQGEGAYDTAANVMAGYNPAKMTAATFDDRIANIQKTLENKYGSKTYTGDKTKLDERLAAIQQAKQDFLDAENETDLIYADKVKKKKLKRDNNIIGRFFKQKKQQKEDDRIAKEKADAATVAQNATYYTPTGTSGGGAGQGIDISGAGTVRSSDNNFQGDSGPTNQQESEYGYSTDFGFARGGRVNFKHGGLASIL